MTQYIDKGTLIAEIKRLIDRSEYSEVYDYAFRDGNNAVCIHILNFLDNLKAKEVDEGIIMDKEKIKEINNRIESQHKEYLSKLRDANREAKDFEMNN